MSWKKKLPIFWMITDSSRIDVIKAAEKLPRNSGIILRDYNMSDEERLSLGLCLKKICIRKKIILLVARDAKLAIKINADGIHLPEYMANKINFWRNKKPYWLITTTAHSAKSVKYAANYGANAVLISPIFATASHPEKRPLGILRAMKFMFFVNKKTLVAYALGGIKPKHDIMLKMAQFQGFAAISRFEN